MKASIALLLSGLAAQQVSATWNRHAGHFNSPEYNNNECSDKQKEGFNWKDVPTGDFSNYGDFNFKGGKDKWTCADRFGKRDSLTKRTFNSRCVKNKVGKDKPAAFDCTERKEGFSVKEIQVSVEYDCDLEFHYKMPDESICKQITPCKKEGTTVQNTQCGGAKEVEVYLGNHDEGDREDCEIGFHHIGFDCNPGYTPPPKTEYPSSTPSETPSETPSPPPESTTEGYSTSEVSTPPPETPTGGYSTSPPETTAPPVDSTSSVPIYTNSSSTIETPPVYSVPETTEIPSSSSPVPESSTSVTESSTTEGPGYTPSSPAPATETSTPPPATYTTETPPPSSSSPPPPPEGGYTPPECLPKCMNTWLDINAKCKDNTDSQCYCANKDFTKSVIECVAAWSTDEETQKALQYLLGICAAHVPENPGLITDCPTYIPINPTSPPEATPTPSPSGGEAPPPETTAAPSTSVAPPAVPVTTITYQTTVTVPCSTVSEGSTISSTTVSTISTYVTVPQVTFSSQTPAQPEAPGVTASEPPVVLVPGTPPPVPAQTTVPPYPTGGVPTTLGTGVVPSGSATVSSPAEFTGAASPVNAKFAPALLGAALAFFAL